MNPKPLLALTLIALFSSAALAEKPGENSGSQPNLFKQGEALPPAANSTAASLLNTGVVDLTKPAGDKKDKNGEKKAKGPTEITALEATFDQKANLAVFMGDVVVKDPEFNVSCDKLTAYLKHDEKPKAGQPKAATPAPKPEETSAAPKKKGGGLERAIAESTGDRRVVITQAKLEADGSTTMSVGKANKATYDAVTGDVVLTGSPEVIQGINRVVAVDPGTVMTLNRDGRMRADGLTKSTIVDRPESR